MKTALALAFAALTATASAVEYVTQNVAGPQSDEENKPPTQRVLNVDPTSLVELVGYVPSEQSGTTPDIKITHSDGTVSRIGRWPNANGFWAFAGITRITVIADNNYFYSLTWKITPRSDAVSPSTVLVLPENSTGNFDVIIESSGDLVSWSPFFSQTVNSQAATRFFRTRVVKTP